MSACLFLLGTDHKFQCGGRDCSLDQALGFATYVRIVCQQHNIQRIAEEMSLDGRIRYEVEETVAQRIARELKIHHHEIDLSRSERNALSLADSTFLNAMSPFQSRDGGISLRNKFDALTDEVRERVWAARIMSGSQWPVLFILGTDHVITFQKVWCRLDGTVELLRKDFAP